MLEWKNIFVNYHSLGYLFATKPHRQYQTQCGSAERLRATNSNSGVSDQQGVVHIPSHDTLVLKQDTSPLLRTSGWDVKPLVTCVV